MVGCFQKKKKGKIHGKKNLLVIACSIHYKGQKGERVKNTKKNTEKLEKEEDGFLSLMLSK